MTELDDLKPNKAARVMDLLDEAGVDVSTWAIDFKGQSPAANPKYCYNWSFEKTAELVVVCLWHEELTKDEDGIIYTGNMRIPLKGKGKAQWKSRAENFDQHLRLAYQGALPVRAIILAGKRRYNDEDEPKSSSVSARFLDDLPWAVWQYGVDNGDFILRRGALPIIDAEQDDLEYAAFEGEQRRLYVIHRRRERMLRTKKIQASKFENNGVIRCEVTGCSFDFEKRYGAIGAGYAHVHHLLPLANADLAGCKTNLKDLAVVCANCHAMIHVGGQNRPLKGLIPADCSR